VRRVAFLSVGVIALLAGSTILTSDAVASESADKTVDLPPGQWRIVRMRVTAYCPCAKCCGQSADGITANGHRIAEGDRFVAADRQYTFGTELIIPGYHGDTPVRVLDRGGAIKGNKLDVFFNTHQEALEWGVRHLDVNVRVQ
jgi:3D (Asp-Asp-Asp) domain-containing protein